MTLPVIFSQMYWDLHSPGLCLEDVRLYPNITRDILEREYFLPFQVNV